MRILDRQRYWAFLKAYLVCFTALVGLYIVIHAFTNIDEFTKISTNVFGLFGHMGHYYLVRMTLFYDRLCGVIAMMAAIFTVTWMQKDNELLAMMAAGVSAPRAIRPVLICSVIVSALAVANQEFLLPRFRAEYPRKPDDDGSRTVAVYSRHDVNDIYIHGKHAFPPRLTMVMNATLPETLTGTLRELFAKEATWIPPGHPRAPLSGGWLLRGATISPPLEQQPLHDDSRPLIPLDPAELQGFPPSMLDPSKVDEEAEHVYFLRTNVSFDMVTRERLWYEYATLPELLDALADPSNRAERNDLEVALHHRLLRPALSLSLLLLSLPMVLGGYGRNVFVNLGSALGTSALFYGLIFLSQYMGTNLVISPMLSAWSVLLVFGTLAYARWPKIRT